jgi:hypothetical protein
LKCSLPLAYRIFDLLLVVVFFHYVIDCCQVSRAAPLTFHWSEVQDRRFVGSELTFSIPVKTDGPVETVQVRTWIKWEMGNLLCSQCLSWNVSWKFYALFTSLFLLLHLLNPTSFCACPKPRPASTT